MMMNRPAFTWLVNEHKNAVYGLAVHLLRNQEDAQDVVQDVFLKLWRKGDEVERSACGVWLMRVCRNACLDLLRRRRVRFRHNADPSVTVRGAGPFGRDERDSGREELFDLSDEGAGARRIEEATGVTEVIETMRTLKEPQRSVILLRELHHLPYEEIAGILDLSLSAVKVTLHRARKNVRQRLEEAKEAQA